MARKTKSQRQEVFTFAIDIGLILFFASVFVSFHSAIENGNWVVLVMVALFVVVFLGRLRNVKFRYSDDEKSINAEVSGSTDEDLIEPSGKKGLE